MPCFIFTTSNEQPITSHTHNRHTRIYAVHTHNIKHGLVCGVRYVPPTLLHTALLPTSTHIDSCLDHPSVHSIPLPRSPSTTSQGYYQPTYLNHSTSSFILLTYLTSTILYLLSLTPFFFFLHGFNSLASTYLHTLLSASRISFLLSSRCGFAVDLAIVYPRHLHQFLSRCISPRLSSS